MKNKQVLSFCIILCLLFTVTNISISAQTTQNHLMIVNYNQQTRIASQEINSYINQAGNTVAFYGKHLDVDEIVESYFSDPAILKLKNVNTPMVFSESSVEEPVVSSTVNGSTLPVISTTNIRSTYAIIATNINNQVVLSYYSFTYDPNAEDDMDFYYNEALSVDNVTNLANTFAIEKQNESITRSTLVQDIRDTDTFFDYYYPLGGPNGYLMKMYQKNITYQAVKLDDAISDYDYYYIVPYVRITPGNSLTQEFPEYINAPVVIGAQTSIYRKYTVDSLIDGTPDDSTVEPMEPKDYSYSLSLDSHGTIAIGFSWTPTNKVTRTTTFDDGYFSNFYGGQDASRKWCISTTQFTYKMGAYVRSRGSHFVFNVNTQVKTLFQNQGLSDAKWSGNPMTLSYTS